MFKGHHVSRKNIIGWFLREISEQNCFISNILLLLFSGFLFLFCLFCFCFCFVFSSFFLSFFFLSFFPFYFILYFIILIRWLLSVFVSPKALAFHYLV